VLRVSSNPVVSHIEHDLFGEAKEKSAESQLVALQKRQELSGHIHAAFNGSKASGQWLIKYLDEYLKAPIWMPNESENVLMYREGARMFVTFLLKEYNAGGAPLDNGKTK